MTVCLPYTLIGYRAGFHVFFSLGCPPYLVGSFLFFFAMVGLYVVFHFPIPSLPFVQPVVFFFLAHYRFARASCLPPFLYGPTDRPWVPGACVFQPPPPCLPLCPPSSGDLNAVHISPPVYFGYLTRLRLFFFLVPLPKGSFRNFRGVPIVPSHFWFLADAPFCWRLLTVGWCSVRVFLPT